MRDTITVGKDRDGGFPDVPSINRTLRVNERILVINNLTQGHGNAGLMNVGAVVIAQLHLEVDGLSKAHGMIDVTRCEKPGHLLGDDDL